ncbi:hypothetical protein O1Y80_004787 [Yersinia enterocolitica]|nr:hypothetical protein [Yersinia enterocolitica]EKN3834402.1 hypothetical protein [Yersinia enterocolitica]
MNNLEELFIANAELAAELLQHMADNEIDSDYFAVVTDSPNCGREVQSEHSVTEVALMAAGIIEQLIAQLEAKNIRADACVNAFEGIETERFAGKSIGEFLAGEVILNKAEPKPDGSFGFTFSGLAIQIMAESFADQFKSSGAVNYLELLFDHSEVGPLTVTMQRVDGLTPAQKLATAEAALSAANEKLKGEQVPVAVIVLSKNWPDTGRKVIDYYIEKIQHLPVGTELFTAPQKPVVLSSSTVMSRAYVVQAIKAAGFTVEGE